MKKLLVIMTIVVLAIFSVGCTAKNTAIGQEPNSQVSGQEADKNEEEVKGAIKKISYLGNEYEVPSSVERIVITGSMESMEDALLLNVKPVAAITVGGEFPKMFQPIVNQAKSSGEKTQPNFEDILALKPDVILGSSKFPEDVMEKLNKIATTIPVSHISTNWAENLELLGKLVDKEEEAQRIIADYSKEIEAAKASFDASLKDKSVVAIRIRAGNLFIYPEGVFLNPVLYGDLGFIAPEPIKLAKAQENISLEKLSELDPDYIFVQFSSDENADHPKVLEELQNNPIWKSLKASKEDHVFINVVDPLAQGGTAWSKSAFLKAVIESLSK